MPRKPAIAALLVLATACVVWSGLNLPPPQWILKYGLTPGCEPTGEVNVAGVTFIEVGRGIARIGSSWAADHRELGATTGDLLGRVAGPFGLKWGEAAVPSNEMPVHWVEFPHGFALAKTELTNAEYEAFDPKHQRSDYSKGDRDPVVNVTWEDAKMYCAWLTKTSGRPIRLPTESEWEAACRAGSPPEYCFGDDEGGLGEYAWYGGNSDGRAHEVGTRKPNPWGFDDLHGNVWEWCEDLYHESYLLTETVPGPNGQAQVRELSRALPDGTAWLFDSGPPYRVFRGGGWYNDPVICRSAYRAWIDPGLRGGNLGFRPAFTPPDC